MRIYSQFFKRLIDLVFAALAFAVVCPVFILITILLIAANNGKPFFFQARPGKNAKIFKVIKFKTMNDRKDREGKLLPDSQRITKIGKFIRSTSLDEIPQLINVIAGQMSLVGPRPLLVRYLSLYDETQARRHEVRPGITGLAQIRGRNSISWSHRFQLDVYYVDNLSLALDMKIIFLTIKKVLIREGISGQGVDTMEAFNGSKEEG